MRGYWVRSGLLGLYYALLVVIAVLFFTGTASKFIYIDF